MRRFLICGTCTTANNLSPKRGTRVLLSGDEGKLLTTELAVVTSARELATWFYVTSLTEHVGVYEEVAHV